MLNNFLKAEEIGRNLFDKTFPDYTKDYSKGRFDFYDVSGYTSSNTSKLQTKQPYLAEIKVRENTKHNSYQTVMLEVKKYNALMEYTKQSGIPSFYICYYTDACLVCNISHLELNKIEKITILLPVNTKQDNGTEFKFKAIYKVPLSYFKIIKSKGYK